MRPIALLLIVCLLYQGSFQGAVEKFVLRGEDVLLELQGARPSDCYQFTWEHIGTSNNVVVLVSESNPSINPSYSGHVEFSDKKFSLLLKNLQVNDSGVYTAEYKPSKFTGFKTLVEYKVTVQEPVSPVDLTVTSVSSSEDSCNLTVTCTTLGSHINTTFRCDDQTCYKEHETSEITTTNSLEVYWSHGSIICNHSNQVSWTNKSMDMKPPCKSPAVIPPQSGLSVGLIVRIVSTVAVCGGVCGGVYFFKKE
ncbi:SLAM family member 9-like [Genypterus blacodes]|uniref:SLAM family member 9-like n=1 Tax=Genypterus blacodes TaxID=154954 RepID=UPI003F76C453